MYFSHTPVCEPHHRLEIIVTLLTPTQEALLRQIEETRAREKAVIDGFEAHLKTLKAGAGYVETYALVRQASAAGIPVSRIGQAYGTKDAYTIKRIIAANIATPGQMLHAYEALSATPATAPTPTENTLFVEEIFTGHPDFPEFLGENYPVAKIRVVSLETAPSSKIGGVSAVVDLRNKICVGGTRDELALLVNGPRDAYPRALEDALGPLLDKYAPTA